MIRLSNDQKEKLSEAVTSYIHWLAVCEKLGVGYIQEQRRVKLHNELIKALYPDLDDELLSIARYNSKDLFDNITEIVKEKDLDKIIEDPYKYTDILYNVILQERDYLVNNHKWAQRKRDKEVDLNG